MRARRAILAFITAAPLGALSGLAPPPDQPDTPPRSFADFRPSQHGFRFVNSFEGSPVAIAGFELSALGPGRYGICGGMSAAAADLFLARRPAPARGDAPRRGEPLFAYLSKRQMDSFGDRMSQAARFARWMGYPDDGTGGTRAMSLGELAAIAAKLDRGQGVPVGLVLVKRGKGNALWENHQVLAYALVRRAGSRGNSTGVDVRIYDPNYPSNDSVVLRCEPDVVGIETSPLGLPVPVLGVRTTLVVAPKRTAPVRGIFEMPYAPARPPEDLK